MKKFLTYLFWFFISLLFLLFILSSVFPEFFSSVVSYKKGEEVTKVVQVKKNISPPISPLDKIAYDKKLDEVANNPPPKLLTTKIVKDPKTGKKTTVTIPLPPPPPPKTARQKNKKNTTVTIPLPPAPPNIWPVKTVYPNAGAILPFKRVVAYYGNLYSKQMGVLGQYPETEMLQRLDTEVQKWNVADPSTPVIPALHYIVVVAQGSPGVDGKYRFRMPDSEIDKVLAMAEKIHGIVFLDIQVGFSTLQTEVPLLKDYLKLPQVHLGIDPEFSMKSGIRPGKIVGTLDASDINFTANYLANIVKENNLTPKILVVHRYTQKMVTGYEKIKPLPEVQIVMNMDGWGGIAKKINTYQQFIYPEPVQFTGFKLFYKNDILESGTVMMTPEQLLKLNPQPVYIQYQ